MSYEYHLWSWEEERICSSQALAFPAETTWMWSCQTAPFMSLLSSAFTYDSLCSSLWKATLWEERSALLPSHSAQWVHSFLTQAPPGQRETPSHRKKGEKDNRIRPCPLASIHVHIGTCICTHFIHDAYTCTLNTQGAAKGLGMFLFKC